MSILAIDIGGTSIKRGIFDEQGILESTSEYETEAQNGVDALIDKLCNIIFAHKGIRAVGISSSGQVDSRTGHIVFATEAFPGYTGTPLRKILTELIGLPITIDNDVNCAAVGEAKFGAGRRHNDFICITYGTGIGGAIVIDKKIYSGVNGIAGEIGHMLTHANGKACVCGKRGCYEMYGSTKALVENIRKLTGKSMDGQEIFKHFDVPVIREAIDSWIDEVVWGLVSLSHIFNPPCFILGGGILNESYVFKQIGVKLSERVIPSFRNSEIKRAEKGNHAGIYGAYWNAQNSILNSILKE